MHDGDSEKHLTVNAAEYQNERVREREEAGVGVGWVGGGAIFDNSNTCNILRLKDWSAQTIHET